MKMKDIRKAFRERYESYTLPEIDFIPAEKKPKRKLTLPRKLIIVAATALTLAVLCSVAYAAIPAFREYINLKTGIGENYIEIRTAKELDGVRNDLYANYRLMNDIVFNDSDYETGGEFEGGFVPISRNTDDFESFRGVFDGNGHTIYNLKIAPCEYMGLFGMTDSYGNGAGIIMNLRISGGSAVSDESTLYIGAVCGYGNYVIRCGVENFSVVGNDESVTGGIAGFVNIADSCFSDADVTGGLYRGSAAGASRAVVTSYSEKEGELCGRYTAIPPVLSEEKFNEIYSSLEAKYGQDDRKNPALSRYPKLFSAFYCERKLSEITDEQISAYKKHYSDYYYINIDDALGDSDTVYFLEPYVTFSELCRLDEILGTVKDTEELVAYCFGKGAKAGNVFSYTASDESDYYGFDFSDIWVMRDGKPKLKMFN